MKLLRSRSIALLGALAVVTAGSASAQIPSKRPSNDFLPKDKIAPTLDYSDPQLANMLEVWNRRSDASGMKCSECHSSPNAIEFAIAGIQEGDIFRRGVVHHSESDITALVEGSKALRDLLELDQTVDRDTFFAMQPGDQPTRGDGYWERDYTFVSEEVRRVTPGFLLPINSLEDAKELYRQLEVTANPKTIQWPFESPVYSGDTFHPQSRGENTGTIHKWVTVAPIQPKSEAMAEEIDARRSSYLRYPSNENFWHFYDAIQYGAGPFGFSVSAYGPTGSRIAERDPRVDAHELAKGLNGAAADYEMQKYLMGLIAWHDETQEAFKKRGDIAETYLEDPIRAFMPGAQNKDWLKQASSHRVYLKVGDAAGQPIGGTRLAYPEEMIRAFLGDQFVGATPRETEQLLTDHARIGSIDWWSMTKVFGWRDIASTGFYWVDDMLNYGVPHTRNESGKPVTRSNAKPGYPGFQLFSVLRAEVLTHRLSNKMRDGRQGKHRNVQMNLEERHFKGIMNPDGIANADHASLVKLMAINYMKTILYLQIEALQKDLDEGRGMTRVRFGSQEMVAKLVNYNFIKWVEETSPSDADHLNALFDDYMGLYQRVYSRDQSGPAAEGQGDGLIMTVFDRSDFEQELTSMRWPGVVLDYNYDEQALDYSLAMNSKASPKTPRNNPIPSGDSTGFSIRWDGFIQAPFTDDYDITLFSKRSRNGPEEVKVWIEDRLVYHKPHSGKQADMRFQGTARQNEQQHGVSRSASYHIRLEKGERYRIRVELDSPNNGDVYALMYWAGAKHLPNQPVDSKYLYSTSSSERIATDTIPEVVINGLPPEHYGSPASTVYEAVELVANRYDSVAHQFMAEGGNGPITWSRGANFPPGFDISDGGLLTGTADFQTFSRNDVRKTFNFAVTVQDEDGDADAQFVRLKVLDGSSNPSQFDQPDTDETDETDDQTETDSGDSHGGQTSDTSQDDASSTGQTSEVESGSADASSQAGTDDSVMGGISPYTVDIGDAMGSVTSMSQGFLVSTNSSRFRKKQFSDDLTFVPLFEYVDNTGGHNKASVRVRLPENLPPGEYGLMARASVYDDESKMSGFLVSVEADGSRRVYNFLRKRHGKRSDRRSIRGSGFVVKLPINGDNWIGGAQLEPGFTIGLVVAGENASALFTDLELENFTP